MSNKFQELLIRAGHRPDKLAKKWICASCPAGKAPALSVGDDVFFCHRCGCRGNIVTLKKELGIFQDRHWTGKERRAFAKREAEVERIVERVKQRENQARDSLIRQFRLAIDTEQALRMFGKSRLERGEPISDATLQQLFLAAQEGDELERALNRLDYLTPAERVLLFGRVAA